MIVRALRGPNLWAPVPVLEIAPGSNDLARSLFELQCDSGSRISFYASKAGVCAVEFEEECIVRRALELLGRPGALDQLKQFSEDALMGPNTRVLAAAARRRGIPVRRLDQGTLLQLGHGFRQRRLSGTFTDRTSSIGENIGWEKPTAKAILREAGVPVPEGRRVLDVDDAFAAALELRGPVVIKPESANHGRGVFLNLTGREEIAAAFQAASTAADNPAVLVERFMPGAEHRVLVINGTVAAAMRGDPLYAHGDGVRSLRELVDEINQDPRRGDSPEAPLWPVEFDETTLAVLENQSCRPDSVPDPGTAVLLQRNRNHSRDVTAEMHADNRTLCVLAAAAIGLDIAGIDLVCENIARPLAAQGGAILEVNAMPGIMMHLWPGDGERQPVDDRIIEALYPPGATGRIPIIAVNGVDPERVAARFRRRGLFVSDRLMHPWTQIAVIPTPDSLIESEGLPFDRCNVAVFAAEPSTPEQHLLAQVARRVVLVS